MFVEPGHLDFYTLFFVGWKDLCTFTTPIMECESKRPMELFVLVLIIFVGTSFLWKNFVFGKVMLKILCIMSKYYYGYLKLAHQTILSLKSKWQVFFGSFFHPLTNLLLFNMLNWLWPLNRTSGMVLLKLLWYGL